MTLLSDLIQKRKKLLPIDRNSVKSTLAERFLLPPFSVLDARQGYWQKRKKAWLSLGQNTELDHGSNLLDMSASAAGITDPEEVAKWNAARRRKKENGLLGISAQARSHYREPHVSNTLNETTINTFQESKTPNRVQVTQGGTSVFDPVLCEAMYRWFCPKGGKVLDPFAGGDMQGIVAGCIGRSYHGVDLREKQVLANRKRKDEICPDADVKWVIGDSIDICNLLPGQYDFILSNPPYADLEVYSDDPRDLSTMQYHNFLHAYDNIIKSCCSMLKDNRFAFFLVGEVRRKDTGVYYNLVGDTIEAFLDCGMKYYNEAILVTSVGSLPIRVGTMFRDYRKLGKSHQNVLVFVKGDPELACAACGDVYVDDLEMPECWPGMFAIHEEDLRMVNDEYIPYLADLEIGGLDARIVQISPVSSLLPIIESCLIFDILRSEAIRDGKPIPRMWLGTLNGWQRLEDTVELTYVIGDVAYLNREVFPNAELPPRDVPPVRSLRRGPSAP